MGIISSCCRSRCNQLARCHSAQRNTTQHGNNRRTRTSSHYLVKAFTTTHMITVIRKQRPVLPGELLPPPPRKYNKPAPQLPLIK